MVKRYSACFVFCLLGFLANSKDKISVLVNPKKVYIEIGEDRQLLNFDFIVTNLSTDTLTLSRVSVEVFDKENKLINTRFLDNNGTAPSINTLEAKTFITGESQLLFNPFHSFSLNFPLFKVHYEWVFTDTGNNETSVVTEVTPIVYKQKQAFYFPIKGPTLIYDAHDFYAHHRRFNYEFGPIKSLGINSNFMRFGYDFAALDSNNNKISANGKKDEDFVGFGRPVYSIGEGKVIYASNSHKDDKTFDVRKIAGNPLELYGNCIAIMHADSIVSIYGHLKQTA